MAFPSAWKDHEIELYLFGTAKQGEQKLHHWKQWVTMMWPDPLFIWDDWCDLYFAPLCGAWETVTRLTGTVIPDGNWHRRVVCTGAASTGKSSKAAVWILGNWLCAQVGTSCILTSTSFDQLKRRIWADLCDWISKARHGMPLTIVPSDTEIRVRDGDKKNAIFGVAVKSGGDAQEAVDRIKGIHNRRVFVVVDEMTAVPDAIVKACSNLNKGTIEFQFIGLGNALPGDNPHTVHCEPTEGWNSVNVEHQVWTTKKGGVCVHFDGHRSPALQDPKRHHYYIKQDELDADREEFGGENTPEYWTNDRGFWPPSGLSNAVMDMALLNQFEVDRPALWKGQWQMGAACDPAFEGGDRRILYPFKFGEFADGTTGIEYQKPVIVAIDSSADTRFIHYAIADSIQATCEGYQADGKPSPIKPENFTMDTSGEGGGLFAILSGRWSPLINSVEFGGAAEKVQISPDRPTTYHELYANKVTMIWYLLRRYIDGGHIRGLSHPETRNELTAREKRMKGGKTQVVPKSEMKIGSKRSPDLADAATIAAWFLYKQGVVPAGKTGGTPAMTFSDWNKIAAARQYEETYEEAI